MLRTREMRGSERTEVTGSPIPSFIPRTNSPVVNNNDRFDNETIGAALFGAISLRGSNTANSFMREVGVHAISARNNRDRALNLSEGTALFAAFESKIYKLDEPYVTDSDLRLAWAADFKKKNPLKKLVWLESAGVTEAGSGYMGTVPLFRMNGLSIGLGGGFAAGVILRYRFSRPVAMRSGSDALEVSNSTLKALPITAASAKNMEPGSEVEICGQGHFRGDLAVLIRGGANAALGTAGGAFALGATVTLAGEYGVTVASLDGKDKVRVTVRKLDQEAANISAKLMAGLIFPINALFPGNSGLPAWGHGQLKFFAEHLGASGLEGWITTYTTLMASVVVSGAHKDTVISSYDFDLSNPDAAVAYESLIRLDSEAANNAVALNNGVVKLNLGEHEHSIGYNARVTFLGEKLMVYEAVNAKAHGTLTEPDRHMKTYRDKRHKKHFETWLTGNRDINWEVVEVKKDDEDPKSYYHFNFKKNDFITRQPEVDKFFKFADSLGVTKSSNPQEHLIRIPTYRKIISAADDTQSSVDLFFTSEGIQQIRNVSPQKAAVAFLQTLGELDEALSDHPFTTGSEDLRQQVAELYGRYFSLRSGVVLRRDFMDEVRAVKHQYSSLCGRKLSADYKAVKHSLRFSDLVIGLNKKEVDGQQYGSFFTRIGKTTTFHYAKIISSLTKIAGHENSLVHQVSMSGGGISLKSKDEGKIVHPRDEAVRLCSRNI